MRELHLSVKGHYFNRIKQGVKKAEYRLVKPYWTKRLVGQEYDKVVIKHGYPKRGDKSRTMVFRWAGAHKRYKIHREFGKYPVEVYEIPLHPF